MFCCSLDDQKWEIGFHFQGRDHVERGIYQSDISLLTLVALIASEGYGDDDYMYYAKDEEKGVEGIEHIGTKEKVQEMLNLFQHEKVLNITVVNADEQVSSSSAQPVEHYINTQQSCTWKRGEEETELEKSRNDRKAELEKSWIQRETQLRHYEGDTDLSEFCYDELQSDPDAEYVDVDVDSASEQEPAMATSSVQQKLKPVRKPGPTSRSHHEPEHKFFPDWVSEADEFCFPGDFGISDEEDETEGAYKLPSGRKRRPNKVKYRVWFDESLPDAHEQLCKGLCFKHVYQFKEALRDFHIRTSRNFQYHRNTPSRITVWCSE